MDFASLPLWANAAIFLAAAAVVWWAGTRLTRYADAISDMTGLGQALIGMLLLGGITSLPEIAVGITAGVAENADLAVSNILGGVAFQVVIIAVGDALLRGKAMTYQVAKPSILLQAVFSCLLLCVVIAAVLVGDMTILGVGLWSTVILGVGVVMFWLISRTRESQAWLAHPEPGDDAEEQERKPDNLMRAIWSCAGVGAVILVAGSLLSMTGDAIAQSTGISQSFLGATLVGGATSLPEISTVVTAVRIKRYMMAFSDIFGTNIFDLMLIFLIDLAYPGPAVFSEQGRFAAFGAVLGIAVTLIYVSGLIERRNKTYWRLGMDSWAVVGVYLCGVSFLFLLSG